MFHSDQQRCAPSADGTDLTWLDGLRSQRLITNVRHSQIQRHLDHCNTQHSHHTGPRTRRSM